MADPLVSVLMPVYNGGEFLGEALRSITRQTHVDLEIVAIDDGSTDGSYERLLAMQAQDPRIRIVSRGNKGLVATLNEGLGHARGRFVARMDADDIAYPDRLRLQLNRFAATPGCAMCGTGFDTLIGDRLSSGGLAPVYLTGRYDILSQFYTVFIHSTVMFDRDVLGPDTLHYDPAYPHAEDFDLFRRICLSHPVQAIASSQVAYRQHEGAVSARHKAEMRRTHVRIVSENTKGRGVDDIGAITVALGPMDAADVTRLAAFLRGLQSWIAHRPADELASWREGFVQLFYFFYSIVRDTGAPELIAPFIRQAAQGNLVRRREHFAADATSAVSSARFLWDGLAHLDKVEHRLRSKRLPTGRVER